MILLILFHDYPLDYFALISTFLNPIDLSRIMVLLKLDISALLGYTGAIFQYFFGTLVGLFASLCMLFFWVAIPALLMIKKANKKDF
jgi:Cu-processing system permease protein